MVREPESSLSLAEQAAHWWAVLHEEDVTASERQEFAVWVAKSPERIEEYLRIARTVRALKSDPLRFPETPADVLIQEARQGGGTIVPLVDARVVLEPERAPGAVSGLTGTWPGRPVRWASAAAVLLALGATAAYLLSPREYRTHLGEERSILLEDGSRVTLNTSSRIQVSFTQERRQVVLKEGEALFEVAHDPARPFVVESDTARVQAVGTQFDVYRKPDATVVTVVEGQVAVLSASDFVPDKEDAGALMPTRRVSKGEQVAVTARAVTALAHANVTAATAWTQRQLVFDHTSLEEVAGEFARYNRVKILIEADAIRNQEVTGVFRSDDPESFLAFLSNTPGITIQTGQDGTRIVTTRNR